MSPLKLSRTTSTADQDGETVVLDAALAKKVEAVLDAQGIPLKQAFREAMEEVLRKHGGTP